MLIIFIEKSLLGFLVLVEDQKGIYGVLQILVVMGQIVLLNLKGF